jgi:hypothetical protein
MENGYGKRTKLEQFTPHRRGGIGIKAGVVTKKTGKTVDVRVISSDKDDLVVVSANGVIIRTPLTNISKIGRATQGVRIMRIDESDKVASVACIAEVEDEDKQQAIPLDDMTEVVEKTTPNTARKEAKTVTEKISEMNKVTKKSAQKKMISKVIAKPSTAGKKSVAKKATVKPVKISKKASQVKKPVAKLSQAGKKSAEKKPTKPNIAFKKTVVKPVAKKDKNTAPKFTKTQVRGKKK